MSDLVGFIDARCGCPRCEARTGDVYRMIGRCRNCGLGPLLVMYRAGDRAADQDCPGCGNYTTVSTYRRATSDEIPIAVVSGDTPKQTEGAANE